MSRLLKSTWIAAAVVLLLLGAFLYFVPHNMEKETSQASQDVLPNPTPSALPSHNKIYYIVSDERIPFWSIMAKGVQKKAQALGYEIEVLSAQNDAKLELENLAKAIRGKAAGIIVSPTTSSACATILKLAKSAKIPVVISDIGTDDGEYVAYISSNNQEGAYEIGKVLATAIKERGWENGQTAIIAIPQKRLNGQARTAGFMQAMNEAGIKNADLKQQVTFSDDETYAYAKEMIRTYPHLRAIWLQGSDRYSAALRAIKEAGKTGEILLMTFDAEPEFLTLIPNKTLVGAAMQQPYLMGEEALKALDDHLKGKKVEQNYQLQVLAISAKNIADKLPIIQRNVLGMENEE